MGAPQSENITRVARAYSRFLATASLALIGGSRTIQGIPGGTVFIIYISVERTILHRNIYGSLTVPLLHHRGKIARSVLVTLLAPLLVRGGVGRLAGLSVPLAPVQWGGFVAWGAIPSTQVHPSLPALYPGQGGSGTTPRGGVPKCSPLSCTTTAVGGVFAGWVVPVFCFLLVDE